MALEIEIHFGEGRAWTAQPGLAATVWETPAYQLLWADGGSEADLRRIWEARQGRRGWVVVLLAASNNPSRVRVVGPQDARPVRELPAEAVWNLVRKSRDKAPREAAALFAGEFGRFEEAVVPGIRVKDLLTPHFVQERLCQPENQRRLADAVAGETSPLDCARQIVEVVERYGLRPVDSPETPKPITEKDLAVVCYQVVLPAGT